MINTFGPVENLEILVKISESRPLTFKNVLIGEKNLSPKTDQSNKNKVEYSYTAKSRGRHF